jgi:hypothetical protein
MSIVGPARASGQDDDVTELGPEALKNVQAYSAFDVPAEPPGSALLRDRYYGRSRFASSVTERWRMH